MKSQITLNIALMLCIMAAPIDAMDDKRGPRHRINATSHSKQSWDDLNEQLQNTVITPKATHVTSIEQLDALLKESKCVMLGIADLSEQSSKPMTKILEGSSKDDESETIYAYADLHTMPTLKERYTLTAAITIIEFMNGEITSRMPDNNSN